MFSLSTEKVPMPLPEAGVHKKPKAAHSIAQDQTSPPNNGLAYGLSVVVAGLMAVIAWMVLDGS